MRLGIFGGTFDPPHAGHLVVAQDAIEVLRLDRVLFVPAALPPHKQDRTITPAPIRLAMLQAAVGQDARFGVDDLELHREGPSYTVDTLRELRRRDPDAERYLLLGADQYRDLATWREAAEITRLARIAVLSRSGSAGSAAEGAIVVPVTRIDISSTGIRERVRAGKSVRYLVPDPVAAVIREERLYLVET